jgi:menaquinone-dependent protoporphyrinogen IX oxidase
MRVLVTAASKHGATAEIAAEIAGTLAGGERSAAATTGSPAQI